MASFSPRINLVKKHKTFLEKFINWALTAGRVVVIATEGIALFAFLYRFSLDQQIVDLHGQIKQKQAILSYLKSNEDTFRNLQERLALVKQITTTSSSEIQIFSDISKLIPDGVTVNNFSISNQNVKLDLSATSISSLSLFVKNLREYKKINSVSLDKVENRTTSATIAVGISARLNN